MLNMMHDSRPLSPAAPHVDIISLEGASEQIPTPSDNQLTGLHLLLQPRGGENVGLLLFLQGILLTLHNE